MNKKGFIGIQAAILIVVGVVLLFGVSGLVKFTFFQDKTPIIIGLAIFLFLTWKNKRG